jgi:hypothetical protein
MLAFVFVCIFHTQLVCIDIFSSEKVSIQIVMNTTKFWLNPTKEEAVKFKEG